MKKKIFALLAASATLVGCNSVNEPTNIVEKTTDYFNSTIKDKAYLDDDNFEYGNGYVSENGSCSLDKEIVLPLFESSEWELEFKNLTIEQGHVLTFNQSDENNKIYLTFNKTNKIFVIGICNNKKAIRYYNYGFNLGISSFENIDCSIKYKDKMFTFIMNDEEYKLNKFNVNQQNQCTANNLENLSSELRSQIIGVTNSEYLYLDGIGSTYNSAHLFTGSFDAISSHIKYDKENYVEDGFNPLDDKKLFFLGSSIFYGHCTGGYGFVDMIRDHNPYCEVTKETVSGTTLAKTSEKTNSYLERMDAMIAKTNGNYNYISEDDALIVQLSTNDFNAGLNNGEVLEDDIIESSAFDKTTICGAIEYICARARELNPNIKLVFISCPILSSWATRNKYKTFNDGLMLELAEKWDINFLDLLNYLPAADLYNKKDTSSNSGFFYDEIHPNYIGYSSLVYPLVNEYISNLFK